MIKSFIARNVYEPLHSRIYTKDNRLDLYYFYKKAQWNTLDENVRIQAKKLYSLIKYAAENIPYYNYVVKKNKIAFSEESIFEDIKKFPVLTKEIVRKKFDSIHKIRDGDEWYENASAGTTGEPVKLIQDKNFKSESAAMARIQEEWAGYYLGDVEIKLWGSEKDILKEKESFKHRFANWMKSIYLLNSFLMDEEKMKRYVTLINKKKPKMILAYSQSIYELAKFIEKNNLKVFSPRAIMTSAGKLYPELRITIERVFKCRVFDRYGSREVGPIACDCEKHEGLHLSIFTQYLEILDDNLKPCVEGQTGDIYLTLLTNYTMPLIRYKIGDVGRYTRKKCSCGRGLPIIKEILGRDLDNFITEDRRIIHGGLFVHFIAVVFSNNGIEKFQIIQTSYKKIEMKVVLNNQELFNKRKDEIEKFIKKMMGVECHIKWIFVKNIPVLKSGKYRYSIRAF